MRWSSVQPSELPAPIDHNPRVGVGQLMPTRPPAVARDDGHLDPWFVGRWRVGGQREALAGDDAVKLGYLRVREQAGHGRERLGS